jgi:hypothetical protein
MKDQSNISQGVPVEGIVEVIQILGCSYKELDVRNHTIQFTIYIDIVM